MSDKIVTLVYDVRVREDEVYDDEEDKAVRKMFEDDELCANPVKIKVREEDEFSEDVREDPSRV